ncbi:MAG: flagellar biosynthesis anti-sigma factor FlgM [Lautropia sp. SCN 70-15]|jgi:negative regulator of flagellin synthesis FlgM|nr:MAG: flagellar biosynthesis anti-sigma factor FlgM [Lautropia sp. SCN 70-15]
MKIGKLADPERIDLLQAAKPASGERSDKVERTQPVDEVSLSSASRSLATESAGAEADPTRSQKVAEIRQAIREGRFEVNAWAVADRMISEAAELLESLSRTR